MLSYGFWRKRFGADTSLIGKQVRLNGVSFTVIGVLPERFDYHAYGRKPEAFIPYLRGDSLLAKDGIFSTVIGRLKEGVTQEPAQAELNAIGARLTKARQDEAARNLASGAAGDKGRSDDRASI
jgi:putative ABC transport system permease protein